MKAILFIPGILVFFAIAPGASAQSQLPEGPNQKLVELVCSKCHTTDRIASKRMSKAEWKEEVTEMLQEEDDVTEAEKDEIIDYLARTFPAKAEFNNRRSDKGRTQRGSESFERQFGRDRPVPPAGQPIQNARRSELSEFSQNAARVYPPMDGWSFSRPDRRPSLLVHRLLQVSPSGFRT